MPSSADTGSPPVEARSSPWKQQVLLNVVAGKRYFVVVAYKPERSWPHHWPVLHSSCTKSPRSSGTSAGRDEAPVTKRGQILPLARRPDRDAREAKARPDPGVLTRCITWLQSRHVHRLANRGVVAWLNDLKDKRARIRIAARLRQAEAGSLGDGNRLKATSVKCECTSDPAIACTSSAEVG